MPKSLAPHQVLQPSLVILAMLLFASGTAAAQATSEPQDTVTYTWGTPDSVFAVSTGHLSPELLMETELLEVAGEVSLAGYELLPDSGQLTLYLSPLEAGELELRPLRATLGSPSAEPLDLGVFGATIVDEQDNWLHTSMVEMQRRTNLHMVTVIPNTRSAPLRLEQVRYLPHGEEPGRIHALATPDAEGALPELRRLASPGTGRAWRDDGGEIPEQLIPGVRLVDPQNPDLTIPAGESLVLVWTDLAFPHPEHTLYDFQPLVEFTEPDGDVVYTGVPVGALTWVGRGFGQ